MLVILLRLFISLWTVLLLLLFRISRSTTTTTGLHSLLLACLHRLAASLFRPAPPLHSHNDSPTHRFVLPAVSLSTHARSFTVQTSPPHYTLTTIHRHTGLYTLLLACLLSLVASLYRAGVVCKNHPLKNCRGPIFSQTVIVKHSPLGDLFTIAVCEKIAPYCLIIRNSPPPRRLLERGQFFHLVTKSLLSWKTPLFVHMVTLGIQ